MTITVQNQSGVRVDQVELRSGDGFDVADVDFPKRTVTVVAMPYERPAEIIHGSRAVVEVVTRGAFNGIEKRAGQIRANRDHDWGRVVGKVIGLHPSRDEGLVTEIRCFKTELGDETLALCDEGGLDASAGFSLLRREDGRIWPDAEVWQHNRTVRRLNRIRLDHIALLPNPAYEDATVLDVRRGPVGAQEPPGGDATPNRDRLAYLQLRSELDELNRRWA